MITLRLALWSWRGRDIGTVVFPEAVVKFFLDATPEERAKRRAEDVTHGFSRTEGIDVADALATRDRLDRTRHASPLTLADTAILIDTTWCPDCSGRRSSAQYRPRAESGRRF